MSRHIYLNPGELYFGEGPAQIETLLGSCVAIVLRHPRRILGGVCHFLLPERHARTSGTPLDGRYGAEAMQLLLLQARRHGCVAGEFEAKLFGGARALDVGWRGDTVGEHNARFARQLLHRYGIALRCSDLGGTGYRYLRVDLARGEVWVRRGGALTLPGRTAGMPG
ncbi:chemotaxis protein CheD [Chitiniphilus purpureus]|uniref:Probable chemoreceptor glutamine deamidase CheD n=1 Tax=Chitiniphilus purpureus TaxID=2981137 RepID=A0ABY6DPN1_9NEIS|nr:chemotaxis protein CheD [Chitiniphilus sp. CD1]UXY16332.1 chemotaxis protein CheD [Chitiniphilus sp. CD1]